jgi:hypothetical protein
MTSALFLFGTSKVTFASSVGWKSHGYGLSSYVSAGESFYSSATACFSSSITAFFSS